MSFVKILAPDQTEHLNNILKILSEFPFAFDTSPLGSGKTYIAGAVAEAWKYTDVVVVCPATVEKVWNDVFDITSKTRPSSLKNVMVLSYESLRGSIAISSKKKASSPTSPRKSKQSENVIIDIGGRDAMVLKHGLLAIPLIAAKGIYYPTHQLKLKLASGTLFIFDEVHRAKNESSSTHASVGTIVREIIGTGGWSRALLLSGTLFDKLEHATALAKLIGILNVSNLVMMKGPTITLTGVNDIIRWIARVIEKRDKDAALPDYGQHLIRTKHDATVFVHTLITIILSKTSSTMNPPRLEIHQSPKSSSQLDLQDVQLSNDPCSRQSEIPEDDAMGTIDCGNLAVYLSGKNRDNFVLAVAKLAKILAYDKDHETVSFKSIRKFNAKGLGAIELADGDIAIQPPGARITSPRFKKREGIAIPHKIPPGSKISDDGTIITDISSQIDNGDSTFGNITLLLKQIEQCKISIFVALVLQQLESHPNNKIIVALNYLDSISQVAERIRRDMKGSSSQVAIVTGSTNKLDRSLIFSKFQEYNTNLRVLVASINVISLGISLDDQSEGGHFKRIIYASPNYYAINQHQLVRRVYRRNTTSQPIVRFVYGANPVGQEVMTSPQRKSPNRKMSPTSIKRLETSSSSVIHERGILKALHRKSQILRSTIRDKSVTDKILFADEYPEEFIAEEDIFTKSLSNSEDYN